MTSRALRLLRTSLSLLLWHHSLKIQDFDSKNWQIRFPHFLHCILFFSLIIELFLIFLTSLTQSLHVVRVDLIQQTLTLFDRQSQTSTAYFGDSMLLGAFFAPQSYVCLQERAVERFFDFVHLYEQKAGLLAGKLATRPECQAPLLQAQTFLQSIRQQQIADLIPAIAVSITETNRQLLSYDCPALY